MHASRQGRLTHYGCSTTVVPIASGVGFHCAAICSGAGDPQHGLGSRATSAVHALGEGLAAFHCVCGPALHARRRGNWHIGIGVRAHRNAGRIGAKLEPTEGGLDRRHRGSRLHRIQRVAEHRGASGMGILRSDAGHAFPGIGDRSFATAAMGGNSPSGAVARESCTLRAKCPKSPCLISVSCLLSKQHARSETKRGVGDFYYPYDLPRQQFRRSCEFRHVLDTEYAAAQPRKAMNGPQFQIPAGSRRSACITIESHMIAMTQIRNLKKRWLPGRRRGVSPA